MIGLTWDVYVCGDAAGAGGMGRREEGRVKTFCVWYSVHVYLSIEPVTLGSYI